MQTDLATARDQGAPAAGATRVLGVVTVALVPLSIAYAAFRGLRLPNAWSATLWSVSVSDGFHRRFLVGTLLHPLAVAFDYHYWLFAVAAVAVLLAVVAVIVVLACRTRLLSQRLLVILWFLLPTGTFFFNEVGYFEQVLYLLLFASVWALRRRRWAVASMLMVLAVCTHEIALLTVVPVLGFVALTELPLRRAATVLAAPVLVGGTILALPRADSGTVHSFGAMLGRSADFVPRSDALALFGWSQSTAWRLYSPGDAFRYLLPIAVLVATAFVILGVLDARGPERGGWRSRVGPTALGCGAIVAPLLLAFAGWDRYRWGFLLVTNFFVVLWIWIGRRDRELDLAQLGILAVTILLSLQATVIYFDGVRPRKLSADGVSAFAHEISDGSFFELPRDRSALPLLELRLHPPSSRRSP